MPVIAMQVIEAKQHPDADSLRLYTFSAPEQEPVQVIANLENVYQEGDIVIVALVGSVLKDGLKIKRTKLRGIPSFGMAMGKTDHPVGTDLSEDYCKPPEDPTDGKPPIDVVKWSSIEHLHHIRSNTEKIYKKSQGEVELPIKTYRAKVKLDGTNGAIHLMPDGEVYAQSRTRMLTTQDDNLHFAKWVQEHKSYFSKLASDLGEHTILFGEWCGQGIQKRTSISKIDKRIFAVFAVQYGDHELTESRIDIAPERIRALLPEHPEVYILPWCEGDIVFDFSRLDDMQKAADKTNELVNQVESSDPWVKENFGVCGMGEGVVMYPVHDDMLKGPLERGFVTRWMFKAKGEKHQVVRQNKPAQLDPELVKSIQGFVDLVATPARLEQAIGEACSDPLDIKQIGGFLKWIMNDIHKETQVELEQSGLEWKQVAKALTNTVKAWFIGRLKGIH